MNILDNITPPTTPTTTYVPPEDFNELIGSIDKRITDSVAYYTNINKQLKIINDPLEKIKNWIGKQKGNLTDYDSNIQQLKQQIIELNNKLNEAKNSDETDKSEIKRITKQLEECNEAKNKIEDDRKALSDKVENVTEAMRNWDKQLEGNENMEFKGDELKGMVETIKAMSSDVDEMNNMGYPPPGNDSSTVPSGPDSVPVTISPSSPPSGPDSVPVTISLVDNNNDKSSSGGKGKKRKHIKTRRKTHSRTRSKSSKSKKSKKSNKTKKLKKLKHKNSRKRSGK
jgi:uncharacterized phage infection (PIP) family protein YhgE